MMDRLARETDEGKKIAVVLDNARFHHAQGPDRPLRPRSGPRAHHAHLHAPLRPRPWVPQNTYGTPPRTISPTPARSPRRTPSRPSPTTSPTAPSTTTSSTSQSHHHTPILFNSSHTSPRVRWWTLLCSGRRVLSRCGAQSGETIRADHLTHGVLVLPGLPAVSQGARCADLLQPKGMANAEEVDCWACLGQP